MKIDEMRKAFAVRPGYWFAPKLFGWGATPVTWQGWAATILYSAVVIALAAWLDNSPAGIAAIGAVTLVFLIIAWVKTDGGWRWHWGWRR